jgi:antitoxin component YwqK of YwqJK toxin-antitoxin module
MLDQCIEFCKQYESNPNIVYKRCGNYIVVLKKLEDTITNETRSNVADPMYAKFRADKLETVCIFSKNNPTVQLKSIENTNFREKKLYIAEQVVSVNNYDFNMNIVCTRGIHYFKTIIAAFYYNLELGGYTGHHITYYDNGNKYRKCEYVDGILHGQFTEWHDNGNKRLEYVKKYGIMHGTYVEWRADGSKEIECECVDGNKHGQWIKWHLSGHKDIECEYINGQKHGQYRDWYNNGNKRLECCYVDGQLHGPSTMWHNGGTRKIECCYVVGHLHGQYREWYNDGNKKIECDYVVGQLHGHYVEWSNSGSKLK